MRAISMNENLFPNLEQMLAPLRQGLPSRVQYPRVSSARAQSFRAYRLSKPVRQTNQREAIYLSRIGRLTDAQELVLTATADFLSRFFELPLHRGADLDPDTFPTYSFRQHPSRGHSQLITGPLFDEVLLPNRPRSAVICMAATAWDLCSDEHNVEGWGSGLGEARYGSAGIWSLCHLGDPTKSDRAFQGCLRRSCAVAAHEALHVLGLDHCADVPCLMRGSACLSGPLQLCPPCFRKLCWNRQLDLLPYLERLREFFEIHARSEDRQRVDVMIRLLARKPWKQGSRINSP
jgi:archaemetzincin